MVDTKNDDSRRDEKEKRVKGNFSTSALATVSMDEFLNKISDLGEFDDIPSVIKRLESLLPSDEERPFNKEELKNFYAALNEFPSYYVSRWIAKEMASLGRLRLSGLSPEERVEKSKNIIANAKKKTEELKKQIDESQVISTYALKLGAGRIKGEFETLELMTNSMRSLLDGIRDLDNTESIVYGLASLLPGDNETSLSNKETENFFMALCQFPSIYSTQLVEKQISADPEKKMNEVVTNIAQDERIVSSISSVSPDFFMSMYEKKELRPMLNGLLENPRMMGILTPAFFIKRYANLGKRRVLVDLLEKVLPSFNEEEKKTNTILDPVSKEYKSFYHLLVEGEATDAAIDLISTDKQWHIKPFSTEKDKAKHTPFSMMIEQAAERGSESIQLFLNKVESDHNTCLQNLASDIFWGPFYFYPDKVKIDVINALNQADYVALDDSVKLALLKNLLPLVNDCKRETFPSVVWSLLCSIKNQNTVQQLANAIYPATETGILIGIQSILLYALNNANCVPLTDRVKLTLLYNLLPIVHYSEDADDTLRMAVWSLLSTIKEDMLQQLARDEHNLAGIKSVLLWRAEKNNDRWQPGRSENKQFSTMLENTFDYKKTEPHITKGNGFFSSHSPSSIREYITTNMIQSMNPRKVIKALKVYQAIDNQNQENLETALAINTGTGWGKVTSHEMYRKRLSDFEQEDSVDNTVNQSNFNRTKK